jgi:hypothetical protein
MNIVEVVADHELWNWHDFFGMGGSHSDIDVLQRSPVFARLAVGHTRECNYEINDHQHTAGAKLTWGQTVLVRDE